MVVDLRVKEKACSSCKVVKPLEEFSRNGNKRRSNCKVCARDSKAAWHQRNIPLDRSRRKERRDRARQFVRSLKTSPCNDCGGLFHHSLMDFDHVRGEKEINIASAISASLSQKAIEAEIAKCELVCCMCHRIRTWNRKNPEDQIGV